MNVLDLILDRGLSRLLPNAREREGAVRRIRDAAINLGFRCPRCDVIAFHAQNERTESFRCSACHVDWTVTTVIDVGAPK